MASASKLPQCESDYGHWSVRCRKRATERRQSMRWGDESKGEPLIAPCTLHFCRACAKLYDDMQDEGRAEARVS